jgi:hypothetical protein
MDIEKGDLIITKHHTGVVYKTEHKSQKSQAQVIDVMVLSCDDSFDGQLLKVGEFYEFLVTSINDIRKGYVKL